MYARIFILILLSALSYVLVCCGGNTSEADVAWRHTVNEYRQVAQQYREVIESIRKGEKGVQQRAAALETKGRKLREELERKKEKLPPEEQKQLTDQLENIRSDYYSFLKGKTAK